MGEHSNKMKTRSEELWNTLDKGKGANPSTEPHEEEDT